MLVRLRSRWVLFCTFARVLESRFNKSNVRNTSNIQYRSAYRDGLERIQLADSATVADLIKQIKEALDIPAEGMILSRNKDLVGLPQCSNSSYI